MKKVIAALFVTALALTFVGEASAQGMGWGQPILLRWRTFKAADPNGGATDSVEIYNGATSDADTSLPFQLNFPHNALPTDSTFYFRVSVQGTQAFASGESLYVTFDGQDSPGSWTALGLATCGTCMTGGYGAAGTLVPGTNTGASRLFIPTGSTTAVNVASAGIVPTVIYGGNLRAYRTLRMRLRSDSAVAPVAQLIRIYVEATSAQPQPVNLSSQ